MESGWVSEAGSSDGALFALFRAIAAGNDGQVRRLLDSAPELATRSLRNGASRADAETYLLTAIRHYAYAGDTALHIAAAAYRRELAESLVASGADVRAANRRGAEPLHYAADGGPDDPHWDPEAQRAVITYLVGAGAAPDALDKNDVAPLHRAVRNRSSAAVRALIDKGADVRLPNHRGSTPLRLAERNTGRSNSGSAAAKAEQRLIIDLLHRHSAG